MSERETEPQAARHRSPLRLVVFGVTGQLGQELVDRLDESDWPIAELVGVASDRSAGASFDFRGEDLDVTSDWPVLKGRDLVFLCTRGIEALEVVRECLKAQVPCVDLTGALSGQPDVPLPISVGGPGAAPDELATAPLIACPSATTLAWASLLEAIGGAAEVTRVVGTVLSSASAQGHRGVLALSQESIALFNQSEFPDPGPAGQGVAFDVLPGGGVDAGRVRLELTRLFGERLRVDVAGIQVPTFVGEGSSLSVELVGVLDRSAFESRIAAQDGLRIVPDGIGSRGLAPVADGQVEPIGPTLRDAAGVDEVLVGRIEADPSVEVGQGWRVWLASDPLRLVADHALRVAGRRLGLA